MTNPITTDAQDVLRAICSLRNRSSIGMSEEYANGYFDALRDLERDLSARLASTSPAPDGWVLVPLKVTPEMAGAASKAARNSQVDGYKIIAIWKAMIAAAPQPVVENGHGD